MLANNNMYILYIQPLLASLYTQKRYIKGHKYKAQAFTQYII